MLEYKVDDKTLCAQQFIELAQQVWPGITTRKRPAAPSNAPSTSLPGTARNWWAACASSPTAVFWAPSPRCWCCPGISGRASARRCSGWQSRPHPPCSISGPSPRRSRSTKRTDAPPACARLGCAPKNENKAKEGPRPCFLSAAGGLLLWKRTTNVQASSLRTSSASSAATDWMRASSWPSTITRMRGSVPLTRTSTRPVSPRSSFFSRMAVLMASLL